jgi:HEPN domain-containing protein
MPSREQIFSVVKEWTVKAEHDFQNAAHTLKLGKDCPTDTVCFHAQQCVEKYLKAMLTLSGIPSPKTHEIEKLSTLLPARLRPPLKINEQSLLSEYAAGARYPGWGEISLREAREAVDLAREVRGFSRKILVKAMEHKI